MGHDCHANRKAKPIACCQESSFFGFPCSHGTEFASLSTVLQDLACNWLSKVEQLMRTMLRLLSFCAVIITSSAIAQEHVINERQAVLLELFVRTGSPVSARAIEYANDLAKRKTGLTVVVHDVLKDQSQLSRLWKITRRAGREKPVSPAFYGCDQLHFGFKNAAETGPAIEGLFTVDVYTRSTCPKCKNAKAFIRKLAPRWPAIRFRIYEITNDASARRRWQELCRSQGKLPGLPTIDFAGQVIVGYQGDLITGVTLENLIHRVSQNGSGARASKPVPERTSWRLSSPHTLAFMFGALPLSSALQIAEESESDATTDLDDLPLPDDLTLPEIDETNQPTEQPDAEPVSDVINVPVFGELRPNEIGFPLFTFLVGLVDGFNPCAMWILVFLLSVLVNIKDRRKILLIAGTFVVVSGLAYFAFMAAWLNVFMLIGVARPVQVILGILAILIGFINVKDFFAFKKGVTLSIPESAKPGLYRRVREIVSAQYMTAALAGVIALAVIVNMVELLCTAGLPALYTQVLTMQEFPVWKNYAFLALYISAYMLDDAVLLTIVVATLSHRRLQEREGRWLKLLSGVVILLLGIVMIFRPDWLQLGQ